MNTESLSGFSLNTLETVASTVSLFSIELKHIFITAPLELLSVWTYLNLTSERPTVELTYAPIMYLLSDYKPLNTRVVMIFTLPTELITARVLL